MRHREREVVAGLATDEGKAAPCRIAVIGLGLIGGSLALAWRDRPEVAEVVGIDRDPDVLRDALRLDVVHRVAPDVAAAADCDVIIVAVPALSIVPAVRAVAPHCRPGAIISDVGSTKETICREVLSFLPGHLTFIGGHPMAGSERTGVHAADPYLFQNAVYVLTPPPHCPPEALQLMETLVQAAGAHPLLLSPEEHDRSVAMTSHVPHVAAAALVSTLARVGEELPAAYQLVAGGFRDTTRVASGDPALWRDICLSNRDQVVDVLKQYEEELRRFRALLEEDDHHGVEAAFAEARAVRARLPLRTKGIMGQLFDCVVHVVDRPGAISHVTTLLAEQGINIQDIEILRVREGEGGTLRLAFERRSALDEAVALLREAGYTVRVRDAS